MSIEPASPSVALDHFTALIVEDDSAYADLVVEAFARSGVPRKNFAVVGDGDAALRVLAARPGQGLPAPSLLLLDLRLRRKPGLEVLARLKSDPALRTIPVIMLTGTERPGEFARARELGAKTILVKPLLFGELLEIARGILSDWKNP